MFARLLAAASAVLVMLLSGCYLPTEFKAEIRINAIGDYSMMYVGDLVFAPLYEDAIKGKLTPAEIKDKIAILIRDFERDKVYDPVKNKTTDVSHYKEIVDKGMGRFFVRYQREGWLDDRDTVTFVRRNAVILSMRTKDGVMSVAVQGLGASDSQRIMGLGLDVKGELRVVTNAQVLEHNATMIKPFAGYMVYIWKIDSIVSPPPRIKMKQEPRFIERAPQ